MGKYKDLDPLLHSQLRLAVISLLIGMENADFTYIKKETGATAGNLSVQLDKLEKAGYLSIQKTFKGKRPLTKAAITKKGVKAFEDYVKSIQSYIKK